ncbi:multidrug effflux MFS transporter [Thalassiella azotivora]
MTPPPHATACEPTLPRTADAPVDVVPAAPQVPAPAPEAVAPSTGPEPAPTGGRYLQLVLVLGLLVALGPLTIDLYLPALPAVAADLRTTDAAVQFTLTGIMLGLAVGQLLIGPVSDAVGRRRPLLVGVAAHGLASVACSLAPSIGVLSGVRVLQGFAGAAVSVVAMAVVRDLFSGRRAATLLSHLMLVIGIAPVLAPSLGGYLLTFTDWRGIFWVLAAVAVLLVGLAAVGLRETLPPARRQPARVGATLRTYRRLLRDLPFVGLVLVGGLMMATLFAYVSGSPFVLQEVYGLDEQSYGLVFGANALGIVLASQTNPLLLRRFTPQQMLVAGVVGATTGSLGLLVLAALQAPLPLLLVPLFVAVSSVGYSFPNAPALALSRHGESAGTAAAIMGATQFGVAAASAPLVGVLGTASAVPMGLVMAGTTALASVVLLAGVRPWTLPAIDD